MEPNVTDFSTLKLALDAWHYALMAVLGLISVLGGFYTWASNRSSARKQDMTDLENRVSRLEGTSINHDDLGKVYSEINTVSNQVSELTGTTKSIKGSVDMIHQHLLSNGGKQ